MKASVKGLLVLSTNRWSMAGPMWSPKPYKGNILNVSGEDNKILYLKVKIQRKGSDTLPSRSEKSETQEERKTVGLLPSILEFPSSDKGMICVVVIHVRCNTPVCDPLCVCLSRLSKYPKSLSFFSLSVSVNESCLLNRLYQFSQPTSKIAPALANSWPFACYHGEQWSLAIEDGMGVVGGDVLLKD